MQRRRFLTSSLATSALLLSRLAFGNPSNGNSRSYKFCGRISRAVLGIYLSRSICMEGLFNGRGDLNDNIRMLKTLGAKYIARSICLWGGEAKLLANFDRAQQQVPQARSISPDVVLEACIFEIVTQEVEQVPVPGWAFCALGMDPEKRNFRYEGMLYPKSQRTRSWGQRGGVPDVSQSETKLWFYFLGSVLHRSRVRSYSLGADGDHGSQ